jgi:thioester reductase-like protein
MPTRRTKPVKPAASTAVDDQTRRVVFMTGFPGFISLRLVRALCVEHAAIDFIFLVQERFLTKAHDDVATLKTEPTAASATFMVLAGDITRRHLGLSQAQYDDVTARATDVFHLAAIYDLAVPEGLAWRANVGGTSRVIDLCYDCAGLVRHVYYSTCYVAGARTGKILEAELDRGQRFKNFYESTKHEAEALVRQSMAEIPTIIIRPSVVVGETKSGWTQKFDGPYFGFILVEKLNLGVPLPYLGKSEAEINLVPVDFLVTATAKLWRKPGLEGHTFHLADPQPMLARDVYRYMVKHFVGREPLGTIPPILMALPLSLRPVRELLGVPKEILEYFNHKASYDTSEATAALAGTGVACPRLMDYLPNLLKFYEANRDRAELKWKVM